MTENFNLSIVIISYNTNKILDNCLGSVFKTLATSKLKFEVVVVDNGSVDGSVEMVKRKYPRTVLISNDKNIGYGAANNQGIKKSRGEYVLLLNSDTVALPNSIERLYKYALQKPRAFVGGKLLNRNKSPQSSCGPFFSLSVVFAALFLKGDKLGITRYSPNKPRKVDWVSGACFIGQKKVFLDDLFFDEKIFMYMEEIDLFYRAKKKHHQVFFYPFAKFIHIGSGSSTAGRAGPVLNIYLGLTYFYKKYKNPVERLLLRFMLRTKAVIAWTLGALLGNNYLTDTYGKAFKLA